MYILELLFNAFKNKKIKKQTYDPMEITGTELEEDSDECEHLFLPLDSSRRWLFDGRVFICYNVLC